MDYSQTDTFAQNEVEDPNARARSRSPVQDTENTVKKPRYLQKTRDGAALLKVLVPDAAGGGIIGKQGCTMRVLEEESGGGKLMISKAGVYYPGQNTERILLLTGTVEQVTSLNSSIMQKLREEQNVVKERASKVMFVVPNATAGLIIGKGGCDIKALKERTQASINVQQIDTNAVPGERLITAWGKPEWVEAACQEIISKVGPDLMNVRQNAGLEYGDSVQQEQVRQHMTGGDRRGGGGGDWRANGASARDGSGGDGSGDWRVGGGGGDWHGGGNGSGYGTGANMGAGLFAPPPLNNQPVTALQEQQHLMQAIIVRQQQEMAAQMAIQHAPAVVPARRPPSQEHTGFPVKQEAPQEHNGFGGLDLETVCPQLMKGMKKTATINIEVPEPLSSAILTSGNILAEWRQFSGAEIDLTMTRDGSTRMLTMYGTLGQVQIAYVAVSQKMYQLSTGACQ